MIEELIKQILFKNRPEHIDFKEYGNYSGYICEEATYNDNKKCYEVDRANSMPQKVHSQKAFVAYIKEELKRRENETGKTSTVKITLEGGEFTADDNYNRGRCDYSRLNSEQYNILEAYRNKTLDHEGFLTMLQRLKTSIINFSDLYTRCSKIRIVGRSEMQSQPVFDDKGTADSSFICTYKLEDGTDADAILLASFQCKIPFAKAGDRKYLYTIELLFFNTKSNEIAIRVQIPEWETNEKQAIIDESNDIKKQIEDKTDLLILADF